MKSQGFVVGIDLGTQGCCAYAIDLNGIFLAKGDYPVPEPDNGIQLISDWMKALEGSMSQLRSKLKKLGYEIENCQDFCSSGQMHGLGLLMKDETFISFARQVRLWCYPGSKKESEELSELFGINMPQRMTAVRWLEFLREHPEKAIKVIRITTPAGVLASIVGGLKTSGLAYCDARGMFPLDDYNITYDLEKEALFNRLSQEVKRVNLFGLFPNPCMVGSIIGKIDEKGNILTGLPVGTPIVASAGDQGTAIAGAYVHKKGVAAVSLGTSVCCNLITEKVYKGIHRGIEPFMTSDGVPFIMNHIENGTQWLNNILYMFARAAGVRLKGRKLNKEVFQKFMPFAAAAPVDCGGIAILPFAKPEHGVGLAEEAHSGIFNLTEKNNLPGNILRASIAAFMFTIRHSVEDMRRQNIYAQEYVLGGGFLKKADFVAQMWADIFNTPVCVLGKTATESSAMGAALMALYGHRTSSQKVSWPEFLDEMRPKSGNKFFRPRPKNVAIYNQMFNVYEQLVEKVALQLNSVAWIKTEEKKSNKYSNKEVQ
jgi:sugar (pentulose or hexulose) kinase